MYIAAIDIGSNAVRLLIKNTDHPNLLDNLDVIHEDEYYQRVPLKSGNDTFTYGAIQPKTLALLTYAMCQFAVKMKKYGVSRYRACATAAYRDASNATEVCRRVKHISGLTIDVITGQEEARLTRRSFRTPQEQRNDTFLFVDVGGGSTEVSLVEKGRQTYAHSFHVGSMRYVCNTQSPEEEAALDEAAESLSQKCPTLHYVGVGGCVKMAKSILNKDSDSDIIRVAEMDKLYEELRQLTPKQISLKYSIPLERADIMTPASSIFLRIAHKVNATTIRVPSIGVRNGIITDLYSEWERQNPASAPATD